MSRGPVIIDGKHLDPAPAPDEAPPLPDTMPVPSAMQRGLRLAGRRPNILVRLVWGAFAALITLAAGLAAWDFAAGLMARNPILGWTATILVSIVVLGLLAFVLKELAGIARLARIDRLQSAARDARGDADRAAALTVIDQLEALYRNRDELRLAADELRRRRAELLDADALLDLAERQLLSPLDALALTEVEASARTVAAATALVPMALADVIVVMSANIRMVRRVAEVYGGRAGTLGSLRLLRAVATHLLATGAVAVGDDLIGSVIGGSALSKLSRRIGEGVVNGALTARVGVAAMEVSRPLPFAARHRPKVGKIVQRALAGLFSKD